MNTQTHISKYKKVRRRQMSIRISDEYYNKLEYIAKKGSITPNKLAEIGIIEFIDVIYNDPENDIHDDKLLNQEI